jgi:AbrB family looped-hinge helix DNA binding protein
MNKAVIPGGMPVTVKGQVTIPKPVRDHLGLRPGDRVAFDLDEQGRVGLRKAAGLDAAPGPDRFTRLIGCGTALKGMTTDDVMLLLRGEREDL